MATLLDAAATIAIAAAVIYYVGWYYLWLFRRCFAAHKLEIELTREYYLVIASWCLNWWPFYILFIAVAVTYIVLPSVVSQCGIWLSAAFRTAFPGHSMGVLGSLSIGQWESCISVFITAVFVYALHKMVFRRVCQVFAGAKKQGFAYFPELKELLLLPESSSVQEMKDLVKHTTREGFKILFRDTKKVVLFRFEDQVPNPKVAVIEVAVKNILAMRVEGEAHFGQAISHFEKNP